MAAPAAPTSLAVSASAILDWWQNKISRKAAVKLSFTNNASDAQHRLEKSVNSGTTWTLVTIANVGDATIIGGDLALNTAHLLRLRAENADGVSAWTTSMAHTTPAAPTINAPPTAPNSVTVTSITADTCVVGWTDASTNETAWQIEIRKGDVVQSVYVQAFAVATTVDLGQLFPRVKVSAAIFSARVRAVYVRGSLAVYSAWSAETVFTTAPAAIRVTSPLAVSAEKNAPFSYTIATNTPASSWSSSALPTWLTLTGRVLSGTPTAVGTTSVTLTVGDGATTASPVVVITVVESSIRVTSAATATAQLGQVFSYTIRGAVARGGAPITTYSVDGKPGWLTQNAAELSGTPTEPGTYTMTVTAGNGIQAGTLTVTVIVPQVSFVAPAILAHVGQALSFDVVTTPAETTLTATDLPGWLTLSGHTLTGTPTTVGTAEFVLDAEVEGQVGSQIFTVRVQELFFVATTITGYKGELLVKPIRYLGDGSVTQWLLAGAPDGLSIEVVAEDGDYGDETTRTIITGIPPEEGRYQATAIAKVLRGSGLEVCTAPLTLHIAGPLYLPWLHTNPRLYDLQVQVRGDSAARVLRSFYGKDAKPARTQVETVGDVKTTTQIPAEAANLMTVTRGDQVAIAIVLRDGKHSVQFNLIEGVYLTIRDPESMDSDEYVLGEVALVENVGEELYYLVEWTVDDALLDHLFKQRGITSVQLLAEVSWEYMEGGTLSSAAGTITVVEDVRR